MSGFGSFVRKRQWLSLRFRTIYDTQVLEIVFKCWMRSKCCDHGTRGPIREAAMYLLWTNDHDMGCPLHLDFLDKVFRVVHVPSVVANARSILRNKELSDGVLLNEVNVIFRFVLVEHTMPQGKQPFVPVFLEKGVHRWAIAAVHRHVVKNTRDEVHVEGLLALLGLFIEYVSHFFSFEIIELMSQNLEQY